MMVANCLMYMTNLNSIIAAIVATVAHIVVVVAIVANVAPTIIVVAVVVVVAAVIIIAMNSTSS